MVQRASASHGWHRGMASEQRRSEFLKSPPSIQAHSRGSGAQLPREKYLNVWPGKTPSVQQVWEGWGVSGRRRGSREGPVMESAEHLSHGGALC